MKRVVDIVFLMCFLLSCKATKPAASDSNAMSWFDTWRSADYVEDSTIIGHTFSYYKGGITYVFHEDGTYDFSYPHPHPRYPARYHSGRYTIAEDTIILKDTLCYNIESFDSDNPDTLNCNESQTRYLYQSWFTSRLCLTNSPIDTTETDVIIDLYYLKRE